jgi:RNA polymerase sigma factor (sigma-70 family)
MDEIRQGRRAAFETLFDRYREPIWAFFRRRTPDEGRAEELAQDTFVAVLEGAARYERRGTFRSYLFGIAYNVLLADRRKAVHRATDRLDVEPPARDFADPDPGIWVRDALGGEDEHGSPRDLRHDRHQYRRGAQSRPRRGSPFSRDAHPHRRRRRSRIRAGERRVDRTLPPARGPHGRALGDGCRHRVVARTEDQEIFRLKTEATGTELAIGDSR